MAGYIITSGQSAGYTLNNGDLLLVSGGGTSIATTINDGGETVIFNSGVASSTLLSAEGVLNVSSGGLAVGTTGKGGQEVFTGGSSLSATVSSGSDGIFGGKATSTTINVNGSELVFSGGTSIGATINFGGDQAVFSGTTTGTTVNFDGVEAVLDGMAFNTTVNGGGKVIVGGLGDSGVLSGTVLQSGAEEVVSSGSVASGSMLSIGAEIDLAFLPYVSGAAIASIDPATDMLTVVDGGQTYTQTLVGSYVGDLVDVTSDNASGTLLTLATPACYCGGTLILTDRGEFAVEMLAVGDRVVTVDGSLQVIRWIGQRNYAGRFLAANAKLQPVRFLQGSLGENIPRRDLLVSREHAMFLDNVLAPARYLVNGVTILQEKNLERVDYYHIELDRHDVIIAEGAASETFIDDESRGVFQNAAEYAILYPDMPKSSGFCAPRVESGYELELIRGRLAKLECVRTVA